MQLQVNMDSQTKALEAELTALMEQTKEGCEGLSSATDPLKDIAQILSKQMDTLQWIDQQTGSLHLLLLSYQSHHSV